MKNKYLRNTATFVLAMIIACGALTGCTGIKDKKPDSSKPPISQQQQQQKPAKGQKPSQVKPGQVKPGQPKPGENTHSQNNESRPNAKIEVEKIERTASETLTDTYTITYKDGNTIDFIVTYSADGELKISKIECAADKNGHTPIVEVKEGIWHLDGKNTGIKASDIRILENMTDNTSGGEITDTNKELNKESEKSNSSGKKPTQKTGDKGDK